MQLLVWCPTISRGGGERLLFRLVEALLENPAIKKLGIAIPENAEAQFARLRDPGNKLDVVKIPHASSRQWTIFAFVPELQRRLRQYSKERARKHLQQTFSNASKDFDIAYAFWAQHELFVKSDLPMVATIQDLTALEFPEILGARETAEVRKETQQWLRNCTCVVSSYSTVEKIKRLFPQDADHLSFVHHAISPNETTNTAAITKGPEVPAPYVIYPANINVHKNHYNLLAGFARWRNQMARLVFVGQGTELLRESAIDEGSNLQVTRLRGLVGRLGIHENADFFALGYVPDSELTGLIKNAWALIMPSLAEGGGSFPVEEALSLGVPVLCSNIPVMREHVADRAEAVVWFDPECPQSIAAALEQLEADYSSRKEIALRVVSVHRPNWNEVAAQYISIFENALQQARVSVN